MPFIPVNDLMEHRCSPYFPLSKSDVAKVSYYMTHPSDEGNVKIGVKFNMNDGSQYGNIIEIPLCELKGLIEKVDV